jgi:N-acetyl-beta-hexosaminidase
MRFSLFSYIMLCIMCVCPSVASAAETAVPSGVTPLPNGITIKSGEYTLPESGATFYIKGSSQTLASYLQDCKLRLHQAANYAKANIGIVIKSKKSVPAGSYTDESYTLNIAPRQIRIEAQTEAGAFYAIQTLMQMAAQQHCSAASSTTRPPTVGVDSCSTCHAISVQRRFC